MSPFVRPRFAIAGSDADPGVNAGILGAWPYICMEPYAVFICPTHAITLRVSYAFVVDNLRL